MSKKNENADHGKELHRVNRIVGQLEAVGKMIEQGRYCPEILVQTRAASSALRSLEASILQRHLHHCVKSAIASKSKKDIDSKIGELLEIFKKRLPA